MHADEVETSSRLVRRLLEAQFPGWAALRIEAVPSAGTDNALVPPGRRHGRAPAADSEGGRTSGKGAGMASQARPAAAAGDPRSPGERVAQRLLPLAVVGLPVARRECRWLLGQTWATRLGHAAELGRFVAALHRIDATGVPQPGQHNAFRGVPLSKRDRATRAAIRALAGAIDTVVATAAWSAALDSPPWSGQPIVIHGDLQPANLLLRNGRLSAVIDFGCLGAGDPACDLMAAWTFLPSPARYAFRAATGADDAAWAQGSGLGALVRTDRVALL